MINHIVLSSWSSEQNGLTNGRYIAINLLVFQSALIDALTEKKQLDAIESDFSKVFDYISHGHGKMK